jgi:spermidine synthase
VLSNQRFIPLYILFFISGFPALIYQIVWQRALFTIYGVNIEAITVVISAFLLGLGLGSLLGGFLSKTKFMPLLIVFGLLEFGIGVFGFFSLDIFSYVGANTTGASTSQTFFYSFSVVLFPTLLMGATLPILSEYLILKFANVGRSIGILYAVNTFGSAAACFLTAAFLMDFLGQNLTIKTATTLNLIVGLGAIIFQFKNANLSKYHFTNTDQDIEVVGNKNIIDANEILPLGVSITLAFLIGFISLSYEIVWARIYNFLAAGAPFAFPLLLGCFLAGIGLGSLLSRKYCQGALSKGDRSQLMTLGLFLLFANLIAFLTVPFIDYLVQVFHWAFTFPLIVLSAAMLGATFPLLCHLSFRPDKFAGQYLSYLYFTNILGAVSGTLITGFILMDIMSLANITTINAVLGLSLSFVLFKSAYLERRKEVNLLMGTLVAGLVCIVTGQMSFEYLYEHLLYKRTIKDADIFSHVLESRNGVITLSQNGTLHGGGYYDGIFNTDLVNDKNGIQRPYALSLFHPEPKEILMIGLASGSWANVIAHHPQLEKLTIIEINPSYLELINSYRKTSSILNNSKVEIVIDDGRRWLNSHPDKKFDIIVMNTTYHRRAFASNLLSIEFLKIIKAHLKSGGVHFYNTTSSPEAQKTGAVFFPYAYRYFNFMIVSDMEIRLDPERLKTVLESYQIDGKLIFNLKNKNHVNRLQEVLSIVDNFKPESGWHDPSMESRDSILKRAKNYPIVTDDNMGTEWAYGNYPF